MTYKGVNYADAEAAYKANKINDDAIAKQGLIDDRNNKIMQEIMIEKLTQYPTLTNEITRRGGVAFLEASSHEGYGNRFEGKGRGSAFINNLIVAYEEVAGGKGDVLHTFSNMTGEVFTIPTSGIYPDEQFDIGNTECI